MPRVIALWTFGLLASLLIGGGIGSYFYPGIGEPFGMLAAASAFACARLWATERRKDG